VPARCLTYAQSMCSAEEGHLHIPHHVATATAPCRLPRPQGTRWCEAGGAALVKVLGWRLWSHGQGAEVSWLGWLGDICCICDIPRMDLHTHAIQHATVLTNSVCAALCHQI
jgi:hypothetical protein